MSYKMIRVKEETHKKLKIITAIKGVGIGDYIDEIVKKIQNNELKNINQSK